ncbi:MULTISPECIES: LexA family protein [unclassified Paenibacillus]|uniref:LexA family protein n=1 Tax=unclassified Paenibacillus TaxID=185978 RepID=UPI0009CC4B8C|nr:MULTISPECIES: S24 family peptidase [unclassified Paenibacillus]SLJ94593.1 repressor LexA [Paenibacillus sp. RU5A]SOC67504.1 repressor LexA [Paenibacillus sp. RU26A]SOC68933.1 repressor LexA [Paenibacillus sp. RU5M]
MERGKHTEFELKIRSAIADNLKRLIKENKLSQRKLSEITGIPTSTLSDYVNARSLALPGNVQKLALALGVPKHKIDPSYGESIDVPIESASKIPLVGTICAGDGLLADNNIEEYIYYPFPNKRQPDFALRVKGKSMIGAGINDGDIVYMKKAHWAENNGQIVAALLNNSDEGVLKRMKWSEGDPFISLIPENEQFEPIVALPNEIKICGVYMGHFNIYNQD